MRRVRLTEGQLYRIIRNAVNEEMSNDDCDDYNDPVLMKIRADQGQQLKAQHEKKVEQKFKQLRAQQAESSRKFYYSVKSDILPKFEKLADDMGAVAAFKRYFCQDDEDYARFKKDLMDCINYGLNLGLSKKEIIPTSWSEIHTWYDQDSLEIINEINYFGNVLWEKFTHEHKYYEAAKLASKLCWKIKLWCDNTKNQHKDLKLDDDDKFFLHFYD